MDSMAIHNSSNSNHMVVNNLNKIFMDNNNFLNNNLMDINNLNS